MSCPQSWYNYAPKVVCATFLRPNKSFCVELGKMFYFLNQKLRKSKPGIVDIQISRLHQMLKLKTANTFYWITWEVYTVC